MRDLGNVDLSRESICLNISPRSSLSLPYSVNLLGVFAAPAPPVWGNKTGYKCIGDKEHIVGTQ